MLWVNRSLFVITGTDTGVGKTVLAGLMTGYLQDAGVSAVALKPVCAGDRGDARLLRTASGCSLTLDETNPWHFRAPLAPLLAARQSRQTVKLAQVLAHVHRIEQRFHAVIVEGAGGLLSPLGEQFDSRDLILALRVAPIIVCPNRLGAINQCLLVLAALPRSCSRNARIVLMSPKHPDSASRSNPKLLSELLGDGRVHVLPWLKYPDQWSRALSNQRIHESIGSIVRACTV
jgi:dethiobiotin synthetase